MSDNAERVPDASADERERAGAAEDYGGAPISDSELAEVWEAQPDRQDAAETTGDAAPPPAAPER